MYVVIRRCLERWLVTRMTPTNTKPPHISPLIFCPCANIFALFYFLSCRVPSVRFAEVKVQRLRPGRGATDGVGEPRNGQGWAGKLSYVPVLFRGG